MLIWILMSVGLVVIVAGGFVGRARRERYRAPTGGTHSPSHHDNTSHHDKRGRRSRGRGRH
jgi:hypothetical protein